MYQTYRAPPAGRRAPDGKPGDSASQTHHRLSGRPSNCGNAGRREAGHGPGARREPGQAWHSRTVPD